MKDSKIAWTHHTFNPWVGCTKVSAGCTHCYAETLNHRWGKDNWGPMAERQRTSETYWKQPLTWNKEAERQGEMHRVFCASMADVGEDRRDLDQARMDLAVMIEATPELHWLLLTKRPENMVRLFADWSTSKGPGWPSNVWVGTSVEDQAAADKRIPSLLEIPCTTRFLSVEPMIGPVDLAGYAHIPDSKHQPIPALRGPKGIDWVICGGESGPGFRPMDLAWARSLRDQCRQESTAFFMKQTGGHPHKGEDLADIPADLRIREFPR